MSHIELHRHGAWSLLDGSGHADMWVARAKELKMPALALTDHGTLSGTLEHIAACNEAGIQPIVGVEMYYRDNRLIHDASNKKFYHLTLLAMNDKGWVNISRLTTEAYQDASFYSKPVCDPEMLSRYAEGVYCLGGCIGGRLSQHIMAGSEPEAIVFANVLRSIYKDNLSLEIMNHDFDGQRRLNIDTWRLGYELGIPLTVTGDPHYPIKSWADTHEQLLMTATGQTNMKRQAKKEAGEDIYTMHQENPTLFLMDADEKMAAFRAYHPQMDDRVVQAALDHSGEIVSRFEPITLDATIKMPKLTRKIVAQLNNQEHDWMANEAWWAEQDMQLIKDTLRAWAYEGLEDLKKLYPASHWEKFPVQQYVDQIEHEFDTFESIGDHVWRYMVMAAGECRWARDNGILFAPRGSAVASTVLYCSGVSDIDPIAYDLMFERFINIGRKGMPDIDLDFMPGVRGRGAVKEHTAEIYGRANVIDIGAFQTYGPKSAIRAVCRVNDDQIDYVTADKYAKVLDVLKPIDKLDLEQCAARFPEIEEFKKRHPAMWTHATRIEGHPFTASIHASGVIVKPHDIDLPIATRSSKTKEEGRYPVTAWSDNSEQLANFGFLKLDYLTIENMERHDTIMRALKEREGIEIDLKTLPVRWNGYAVDPMVMDMFKKGYTLGVWQMDGQGTVPVLKGVQPDDMHDLAAINALIRPAARGGGITDEYAKRKQDPSLITYWHEAVEPVLAVTKGLMIYQEQAMEVAVQLGGFTRADADGLRKAMGKKYRDGMPAVIKFLREEGYEEKFLDGARSQVSAEVGMDIWEKTLSYGGYGFNAPHAYRYALMAYHDMFFKKIAKADFYAGLLTSADTKALPGRLSAVLREGKALGGMAIRPPDINLSGHGFTVTDRNTILFGLEGISGVGPTSVAAILSRRSYRTYADFATKITPSQATEKVRKALIGAGAFDAFGMRSMMTMTELAESEDEFIGVRISTASEIDKYAEMIEDTIHTEQEFDDAPDGEYLCVGGEIASFKQVFTKGKGEAMGFVNVIYGADSYRVTMFVNTWAMYSDQVKQGAIVFFEGMKQVDTKYGVGFIVQSMITLNELIAKRA